MKHVTIADKTLFMGDDIADALLEYARVLGNDDHADTVTVHAIGPDGNSVDVAILLNSSAVVVVESTNAEIEPPSNDEAVRYITDAIERIHRPPSAQTEGADSERGFDFEYHD